jgi:hypothetical protein
MHQKHWLWISLHIALICSIIANLFTGLRLAILSKDWLLPLSPILPQGDMYQAHSIGAASLIVTTIIAALCLIKNKLFDKEGSKTGDDTTGNSFNHSTKNNRSLFFELNKIFGYFVILALIATGINHYFQWLPVEKINLHWLMACLLVIYLISHCIVYYLLHGRAVFHYIVNITHRIHQIKSLAVFIVIVITALYIDNYRSLNHYKLLYVAPIKNSTVIRINGKGDESVWQSAHPISIKTFGGDNFDHGQSAVNIKSVANDDEIYFLISWDDPSKSVAHLPIVKTKAGWQVQQNGYDEFAEKTYYEDKFALMFSYQCTKYAGDSIHLGVRPLSGKPKHTSGKGYHYKSDGEINDLWHWKAVRTNDMHQADDYVIEAPSFTEVASRRYTAGYHSDPKESGNYVMNWQWYQQNGLIEPKRLPIAEKYNDESIIGSWFAYQPYKKALDTLPLGSVLPSVLYRSNKFEGDRGDVAAFGTYQQGKWTLELVRKIATGSDHDLAINDGICLWVSAFDHSQIGHTRHLVPIKLLIGSD